MIINSDLGHFAGAWAKVAFAKNFPGGSIFRKLSKFCDNKLIWADQFDFPSSPKTLHGPYFGKFFLRRRQTFQKSVFRQFLEKFNQKIAFFEARSPKT